MLSSCKKTEVDATNLKTFQSSINDLESSLPTIKQIKFNEALYILKTFGVEGDDDISRLKALAKILDGKKVPEILAMADAVAAKNSVDWKSTAPPSLGEMNIFGTHSATERDPNDVSAASLSISTVPIEEDSLLGPQALQIIPRLVDQSGNPISFTGAALETTLQISSGGISLLTAKNLMQNNNFKGFSLRFSKLAANKIQNEKIDIKISVKTSAKTLQMVKAGVSVNPKTLSQPQAPVADSLQIAGNNDNINGATAIEPSATANENPKTTVVKFLNNLNSQNLKAAYEQAENPSWDSYDNFSNPTSGFGSVKNLNITSVTTTNTSDKKATVDAKYNVTDKNGNTVTLDVTYGLQNNNGTWKISNYKINSSQKK